MKPFSILLLAATATAFGMACNSSDGLPTSPDLATTTPTGSWELVSFELADGSAILIPDPSRYTLRLDGEGGANLRADCNVCRSDYTLEGTKVSFGLMACTLAACLPGSFERDYLEALEGVTSYESRGGELALRYPGGVLRFRAAPAA